MKKTVIHYKQTKLAYAPDALVECINLYSKKYRALLIADSNEYLKDDNIPITDRSEINKCDLLHCHNRKLFYFPIADDKPKLIQYHSHPLLCDIDFWGFKCVVAQFQCLLPEYKSFHRVRNIINLDNHIYFPDGGYDAVRIGYSPTCTANATGSVEDKGYTQTCEILNVIKNQFSIEIDIITGVSLEECIRRKNKCHILIDECVTNSYHRCSLEALALGKVAVCSLDDSIRFVITQVTGGNDMPIDNIYINQLQSHLISLIKTPLHELIKRGKMNRLWMEQYWNPKNIVHEFERLYDILCR